MVFPLTSGSWCAGLVLPRQLSTLRATFGKPRGSGSVLSQSAVKCASNDPVLRDRGSDMLLFQHLACRVASGAGWVAIGPNGAARQGGGFRRGLKIVPGGLRKIDGNRHKSTAVSQSRTAAGGAGNRDQAGVTE